MLYFPTCFAFNGPGYFVRGLLAGLGKVVTGKTIHGL